MPHHLFGNDININKFKYILKKWMNVVKKLIHCFLCFFFILLYIFRKQCYENTNADWLKIVFLQLDGDTEPARAVDAMMARAKRIYVLLVKVNKLFSFSSRSFLQEIQNMFTLFLLSYRTTRGSLRELENRVPTALLVLPNFYSCFYVAIRL